MAIDPTSQRRGGVFYYECLNRKFKNMNDTRMNLKTLGVRRYSTDSKNPSGMLSDPEYYDSYFMVIHLIIVLFEEIIRT